MEDRLVHGSSTNSPIVAFDFDGTLTTTDSYTAWLRWRAGPVGWAVGLLRLAPDLAAYAGHGDRGRLKMAATRIFLGGATVTEVSLAAESFAEASAPDLLRPDAMSGWEAWRARGARLVIVTASPELTVEPFARRLGADALIGTRLAADASGRLTGAFDGPNCRGAEKVRRLEARFGQGLRLAAAYGDTAGDREMLAIADEAGYRVFSGRP